MMKATLRSAVLLGLLAWSAPSFAEVQNVRVGGEVNVRAFHRDSLRLSEDVHNQSAATSRVATVTDGLVDGGTAEYGSADDNFLQQLTAVNVDADLTENVSTQVRVINQRVWGAVNDGASDQSTISTESANDVQLSLANISLKELFYSPLTLTVGRQRLWFGRGFIVGSRLLHSDVDPGDALAADEFSDLTAFDAVRATLDLGGTAAMDMPLVLDFVYAKVEEDDISVTGTADSAADDTNLFGVNLGTKFDRGEAELYVWRKDDKSATTSIETDTKPHVNVVGLRGSTAPVAGSDVWGELAYQWGNRVTSAITYDAEGAPGDDFSAWGMNLGADYTMADAAWSPTLGGEWVYFSGDEGVQGGIGTAIAGWDGMYRGRFFSALRDFQATGFYLPAQSGATAGGTFANVTGAQTNQHILALHGTLRPVKDLTVDNRLSWFLADKAVRSTINSKPKRFFGTEWDVQANYAYTDDVNLGLVWGIFMPGSVFRSPYDSIAQEAITSVSVKF